MPKDRLFLWIGWAFYLLPFFAWLWSIPIDYTAKATNETLIGLPAILYDWQQGWAGIAAAAVAGFAAWRTIKATREAANDQVTAIREQLEDERAQRRENQDDRLKFAANLIGRDAEALLDRLEEVKATIQSVCSADQTGGTPANPRETLKGLIVDIPISIRELASSHILHDTGFGRDLAKTVSSVTALNRLLITIPTIGTYHPVSLLDTADQAIEAVNALDFGVDLAAHVEMLDRNASTGRAKN